METPLLIYGGHGFALAARARSQQEAARDLIEAALADGNEEGAHEWTLVLDCFVAAEMVLSNQLLHRRRIPAHLP